MTCSVHNSGRSRCIVFAVISSVISSLATILKVQVVHYLNPLVAACVGVLFAGLLTLLLLWITKGLPTWQSILEARRPLLMLTMCRPVISNVMYTIGIAYTSSVEAMFLTKMESYLVIFWVWILDRVRPSGPHLLLLLVHIAGAVLLAVGDKGMNHGVSWFGDVIIVSAGVAAALSYRYAPQVTRTLKPLQVAAVVETLGGLITLPLILLARPLGFSGDAMIGWAYLMMHSILFYIVAISLLYASLRGLEGWLSSALRATGPVVAAPIAMIFCGDTLTPPQGIGAVIVLITSALISRSDRKVRRA
jgi:drug/metabolite transporter (DMT)-like permease